MGDSEKLARLQVRYDDLADRKQIVSEQFEALSVDYAALQEENSRLTAQLQAREWQPTETVPKDHFARLVYSMEGGGSMVAFVDVTGEWWPFPACCKPLRFIPTHWQPLPVSPDKESIK